MPQHFPKTQLVANITNAHPTNAQKPAKASTPDKARKYQPSDARPVLIMNFSNRYMTGGTAAAHAMPMCLANIINVNESKRVVV